MRGVLITAFILGLCYAACFAQDSDTMHWKAGYRLTWADYKGGPSSAAYALLRGNEMAYTTSGIAIDMHSSGELVLYVNLYTLFYPYKSCTRTDSSTYLLQHEQDHFDLAELYARKMRKAMLQLTLTQKNAVDEVRSVYNRYNDALNEAQQQYDTETAHSLNATVQRQWNVRIAAELKQYAAYANPVLQLRM